VLCFQAGRREGVEPRFEPRGPEGVVFSGSHPPRRARTAAGSRSSIPRAP